MRTPKAISDQQQESLRNLLVKTKTKANFQRVQCLWLRAARLPTVRAAPSTVRSKPSHAFRSLRIIMCTSITTNTGPRVLSAFLTYTGRTSRFSSYNPEMPSPPPVESLYRSCNQVFACLVRLKVCLYYISTSLISPKQLPKQKAANFHA